MVTNKRLFCNTSYGINDLIKFITLETILLTFKLGIRGADIPKGRPEEGSSVAPYTQRPTAVAKEGSWISSIIPFMFVGKPSLTGIAKDLLPLSTAPIVRAPPPVITRPDGVCPPKPLFLISSPTNVKISLSLGLIIPSIKVFLETLLTSSGRWRVERSTSSDVFCHSSSPSSVTLTDLGGLERNNFIFSALSNEILIPIAKSLVICLDPIAKTEE